jgi:hypothetical protein
LFSKDRRKAIYILFGRGDTIRRKNGFLFSVAGRFVFGG